MIFYDITGFHRHGFLQIISIYRHLSDIWFYTGDHTHQPVVFKSGHMLRVPFPFWYSPSGSSIVGIRLRLPVDPLDRRDRGCLADRQAEMRQDLVDHSPGLFWKGLVQIQSAPATHFSVKMTSQSARNNRHLLRWLSFAAQKDSSHTLSSSTASGSSSSSRMNKEPLYSTIVAPISKILILY